MIPQKVKFEQLKGKAKQSVGEALGNQKLANSGAVDQVKGAAQEAWGNAKDAVHAVATMPEPMPPASEESQTPITPTTFETRIMSAAQNAKNAVNAKADEIKREHTHSR